jgi:hypothetical protein
VSAVSMSWAAFSLTNWLGNDGWEAAPLQDTAGQNSGSDPAAATKRSSPECYNQRDD